MCAAVLHRFGQEAVLGQLPPEPPAHLRAVLGDLPDSPGARQLWLLGAAIVTTYRERYDPHHADLALGDPPGDPRAAG